MPFFGFRKGSISGLIALLLSQNPGLGIVNARKLANQTKRDRGSNYKPHYGKQAAARNLLHAKAHTHGLAMTAEDHIVFAQRG